MQKDALSLLLETSGVHGTIFCRAKLAEPWSVITRGSVAIGKTTPAIFHVIVRGEGYVKVLDDADSPPVPWSSGDVILIPHGISHVMCSDPSLDPTQISSLPSPIGPDGLPCVTHGGDGEDVSILCGTISFGDDAAEVLLPHLPSLLHLQGGDGPTAAWLDATLTLLGAETSNALPGADSVVSRLAEVLLVQALRAWIARTPDEHTSWLRALSDPRLSRVIELIHTEPASHWTAESLAREVGISRSILYERFREVVGEPPASYLTRWRMHVARRSLRQGASLAQTAERVGYNSEAAFSRAFKRWVGSSPSVWRASQRGA